MNTNKRVAIILLCALVAAVLLLSPYAATGEHAAAVGAQATLAELYLVKDINPRTHGSGVGCVAAGETWAVCSGDDGQPGVRVWRSDGTPEGSFLLQEIFAEAGWVELNKSALTASGTFYFTTREDCCDYAFGLWRTDGTAAGTVKVADLPSYAGPYSLVTIGEMVYFITTGDGVSTNGALWRSDGTETGTEPFFDFGAGWPPQEMVAYDGALYFVNESVGEGRELWISDGTETNTALFADINPGPPGSDPSVLTVAGDLLTFSAADGVHGRELWKTDGTPAGTQMVLDLYAGELGGLPDRPTAAGGLLFFVAEDEAGQTLWRSDGSAAGTLKLADEMQVEGPIISAEALVYFQFYDADGKLYLGRSDGTAAGTIPLLDMTNDAMSESDVYCLHSYQKLAADSALYFPWGTAATGCELWRSDGTAAGTALVQDILPGSESSQPAPLAYVNDRLLLKATGYPPFDYSVEGFDDELWVTDGSATGARLLLDINETPLSSDPALFAHEDGRVLFAADDGSSGREPWRSDGTTAGTAQAADLRVGKWGSQPGRAVATANGMVFAADTAGEGADLYVSDGTPAGTAVIKSFSAPEGSNYMREMAAWNGYAFFSVIYDGGAAEFWRTDGTATGTVKLGDFATGQMMAADNVLYVRAEVDYGHGVVYTTLWATDGTPAGTWQIDGLSYYYCDLRAKPMAVLGDTLFFAWCDADDDQELWVLDGPEGVPAMVADLNGGESSFPSELTPFGDAVYFRANDGVTGVGLWRTDGTEAGTDMLVLEPVHDLTAIGDGIVFFAEGLWFTDGTTLGTTRVVDMEWPREVAAAADHVFFTIGRPGYMQFPMLMVSDGTEAGTNVVEPGSAGPVVTNLYAAGSTLYLAGADDTHGNELWALSLDGLPPVAAFAAAPTDGVVPHTVTFRNASSGGYDACLWDFGDGTKVDDCALQSHTYEVAGDYAVRLAVSGPGGSDTATREALVHVAGRPVAADFSAAPTNGIAPLATTFTNLSTGDFDTCAWDFGDGTTATGCKGPAHTYAAAGSYTVKLKASGVGGEDTKTRTNYITVYAPAKADFTATPTAGVAPLAVTFKNLSTGDFDTCTWTFGDGAKATGCATQSHTYAASGTYTVSLEVSGLGGKNTKTRSDYVDVYVGVTAGFGATPTSGVAPLAVVFKNLSTGDFDTCAWDFGDGTRRVGCGTQQHTYQTPGSYTVSLSVSGLGGTANRTRSDYIAAYEIVDAGFTAAPTEGIVPFDVTFTNTATGDFDTCLWHFGDGNKATGCDTEVHRYEISGLHTVSLTVKGPGGEDTITLDRYIHAYAPVKAQFTATPTSGPVPLTVTFENYSHGDYDTCEWNFGDGTVVTACGDQEHLYTTTGTYTVTLQVRGPGGMDTLRLEEAITAHGPVHADFTATPRHGMPPLTVQFENLSYGAHDGWTWDFGDGTPVSTEHAPAHVYEAEGTYTVCLTVYGPGGTDMMVKEAYIVVEMYRVYVPLVTER